MKIRKAALVVVMCFVAMPLCAQSRFVFDSNNKTVGQLIGNETRPALIRYILPAGDTVLLEAYPYALRQAGPFSSPVYFTSTANCSAASAFVDPVLTVQLTRRHATTINEFSVTAPTVLTSSRLYVSAPFAPTIQMPLGTMTTSRYQSGICQPVSVPIGGFFLTQVNFTQNLLPLFAPPFWTP